jgi:hypothetical protein
MQIPKKKLTNYHLDALEEITKIERVYKNRLIVNDKLNRALVSFQANKSEPIFRWFKYREGFSKSFVEYCFVESSVKDGAVILDPFAGTGATIFTGAEFGMDGYAIELLPVGCYFMEIRQFIHSKGNEFILNIARNALKEKRWKKVSPKWIFQHLAITKGAFPPDTEIEISKYKTWLSKIDEDEAKFFDFILFSILEEISYTRKDGQYLRWDARSPRTKSTFNKGKISTFDDAIEGKLNQVISDLLFSTNNFFPTKKSKLSNNLRILQGSVFEKINHIKDDAIDLVLTSPPYCNRYDYTRTYALELAYLGINEEKIREIRQTLLTCTVENKPKNFNLVSEDVFQVGKLAFENNKCLNAILKFLENEKDKGLLNNNGILSMVNGYFFDSVIHFAQIYKKIKPGGYYIMANDNVQYNGLPIPVDCILSNLAEAVGFTCEKIWILPVGKGNSSQQMKKHGRNELRKCVYVWRKKL